MTILTSTNGNAQSPCGGIGQKAELGVRDPDSCVEGLQSPIDLRGRNDQRRRQADDALRIERPCRRDPRLEHFRNNRSAVSLVAQLRAHQQSASAYLADYFRARVGDAPSAREE